MNFSVFESLAGSVTAFSIAFGGLFVCMLFWRVSASVIGAFSRLSEQELSVDEWLHFVLKVMAFLMFCGVFLYATT